MLAQSAHRFIELANRWPEHLSLAEHMAANMRDNPLTPDELADEVSALQITVLSLDEPSLRTALLLVHDQLERDFLPVVARRLALPLDHLTVRLCAAAVTGALRVVDEDVGRRVIVEKEKVSQKEALDLVDRAILDATNGRLGGPVP